MKTNEKKVIQIIIGILFSIIISYCIASILTFGNVMCPVDLKNGSFFVENYTQAEIVKNSSNFIVISDKDVKTIVNPCSKTKIDYEKSKKNKTGYILLDVDVLSEENVNMRISILKTKKETEKTYVQVNEGINLYEVSLEDAKQVRLDFVHSVPVSMSINQISFSNQLVGILPVNWYLWFVFSVVVCIEMICVSFFVEIKLQKRICRQLVKFMYKFEECATAFLEFIRAHKWEFLICFCICIFSYGYNLANFSLGIDEERDIVRSLGTLENVKELLLREGRYSLYLYRMLETVDGSLTAFVGEFLSVIFIFLNIVVGVKCFDVVTKGKIRGSAIVVFGGMMATLPFINAEIMCYSIMNAGVYFSMMLTSIALLLVAIYCETKVKNRIMGAMIITVIAMLFTEAHNVWFISGTVLINLIWGLANKEKNWKEWFFYVLHYVVTFLVAFVVCYLIRLVIGQNGYASGYIRWGNSAPVDLIKGIFEWIKMILTSKTIPGALYLGVSVCVFVGFILLNTLKEQKGRASLLLFLSACLLMTPFMLCFIAGSKMPYRTMEALLLLEAGVWFVVINFINKKTIARYVMLFIAVLIIWKQGVWMNRIFYGADLNAKLDMEMGYAIGEEIEKVADTTLVEKPVVFVGMVQHSSPSIHRIEAVGQSIFNRNNSKYTVFYLRYLGFNIQHAGAEQITEAKELAIDMNVWPLEGSVKEFEDIIIVRLN